MDSAMTLIEQSKIENKDLNLTSNEQPLQCVNSLCKLVEHKTQDSLSYLLGRSLVSALSQHTSQEVTEKILFDSGMIAGEDYAYHVLDFEENFAAFAIKMGEVHLTTGLPYWEISKYDPETGAVQLFVRGSAANKSSTGSLLCKYVQGFAIGIFSAYMGQEYTLQMEFEKSFENIGKETVCLYNLSPIEYRCLKNFYPLEPVSFN